ASRGFLGLQDLLDSHVKMHHLGLQVIKALLVWMASEVFLEKLDHKERLLLLKGIQVTVESLAYLEFLVYLEIQGIKEFKESKEVLAQKVPWGTQDHKGFLVPMGSLVIKDFKDQLDLWVPKAEKERTGCWVCKVRVACLGHLGPLVIKVTREKKDTQGCKAWLDLVFLYSAPYLLPIAISTRSATMQAEMINLTGCQVLLLYP
ncbi:UNVERIFIED_CONTAM: hypothetical protein K2H54_056043, partial [Gekko kuhli]